MHRHIGIIGKLKWDIRPEELEGFPRRQRQWLVHWAFEMFRKEHRFAEWIVCGLCFLGLIPGYWVAITMSNWLGFDVTDVVVSMICSLGGGLAGAGVGGWLGRQWLLQRIRPYLRRIT